jgi:hypothetical protein
VEDVPWTLLYFWISNLERLVVGCGTFGDHRANWWSFGIGCANRGCSEKKSENSGRIVADVGAFRGAHGKGHSGLLDRCATT